MRSQKEQSEKKLPWPMLPHRYAIPLFIIFVLSIVLCAELVSERFHPAAVASATAPLQSTHLLPAQMPPFTLHDQDNQVVDFHQLLGHVWIADFIYTECDDSCIVLNQRIIALQHAPELAKLRFVSFSAEAADGPPILKHYLDLNCADADQSRWRVLAADTDQYPKLAVSMGLADAVDDISNGFIAISPCFYLVDSAGHLCGTYDGLSDDDVRRLRSDAARLLAQGGSGSAATQAASAAGALSRVASGRGPS